MSKLSPVLEYRLKMTFVIAIDAVTNEGYFIEQNQSGYEFAQSDPLL